MIVAWNHSDNAQLHVRVLYASFTPDIATQLTKMFQC